MSLLRSGADDGQALVIVGLAMAVLLAALALSVDWGYGFVVRRAAQNEADAAALAAGRLLATSFTGGDPAFNVSAEDVWCAAAAIRDRNRSAQAVPAAELLELSFAGEAAPGDEPAWTTPITNVADCSATSAAEVPPATVYVRVRSAQTYRSLFAAAIRGPIDVAASARVRLTAGASVRPLTLSDSADHGVPGLGMSGATTSPNVAIWPIARHYEPTTYAPGQLVQLWPLPPGKAPFGAFQGLVSLSHQSQFGDNPHQLITESDYTGTSHGGTGPITNHSAQSECGGAYWDTNGSPDATLARTCDLPNWFYYGYRGSISVGTDWASGSWDAYRGTAEPGSALSSTRSSCDDRTDWWYFVAPSCENVDSTRGDWVETVFGAPSPNMAARMREFIARYGRDVPGSTMGKAVVVNIMLWDCAETYNTTGRRWDLLVRGSDPNEDDPDCAKLSRKDVRTNPVNRVHVLTTVAMTFYMDLVSPDGSSIKAYSGDVFGDPAAYTDPGDPAARCLDPVSWASAACRLNPLLNSAFLVPDE